jgi:two-component system, chemotaxis family, chemotaxis protein CheY
VSTAEKVNQEVVKVFASAAIRAVKEQCRAEIQVGSLSVRKPGYTFPTNVDVASFLTIKSEKFSGTMALCYPRTTFLELIRAMTSEAHQIINAGVRDGAAELLNIVFGEVKQVLNSKGYTLPMGIPQVLLADAALERLAEGEQAILVPFETQYGPFFAQIGTLGTQGSSVKSTAVGKVDPESFPEKVRILIVDDMTTMRKVVHRTLNTLGYGDVTEANDGKTAWEQIGIAIQAGMAFDLIISDWNMPQVKGIDLLKQVRANPSIRATPFILLTAESEVSQLMEAVQAGVSAYLIKPFNPETLGAKLKEVYKKTSGRNPKAA